MTPAAVESGTPRITLSCGCQSHYFGFPSEWDAETREGDPAIAHGVLCEVHYHEYQARPAGERALIEAQAKLAAAEADRDLHFEMRVKAEVALEKINRIAHLGTVDSFMALSDEEKRQWFVTTLHNDSEKTKLLREAEAALAESKREYALLQAENAGQETAIGHLSALVDEQRRDIDELNNVLRAAGWGQGEIDSAAEMLAKAEAALAGEREDAERYRRLRDTPCNQIYVTRNEHASNYVSAQEWIDYQAPDLFDGVSETDKQAMRDADNIWTVQMYPDTPIGFYRSSKATLDEAIDEALPSPVTLAGEGGKGAG
jgi:hypothetical protein